MDTLSCLSSLGVISFNSNSSRDNQTHLINSSDATKSLINVNPTLIKLRNSKQNLKVRMKAVNDAIAVADPVQAQVTWQIIVGALAGVTPFIVAGIEFSKRIVKKGRVITSLSDGFGRFFESGKKLTDLPTSGDDIPTMEDILEASKARNLDLNLQKLGPFFRITANNIETKRELGRAEGFTRFWFHSKILHLDSIRLNKETLSMQRSIFGVGLFLGAVAVRHGFDSGCTIAQLLAINDTDLYHSKLVRFYSRMGFKVVHEVDGSSIGDFSHMLIWGGKGTRMDADINHLLLKWCAMLKPKISSATEHQAG